MNEEEKINTPEQAELPAPEKEELLEAPADDVKDQASKTDQEDARAAETSDAAKEAAIDEMEKASQKALDAMREANNSQNEQVVNDAQKKLDDIFDEFRKWVHDSSQPDQVKASLKDLSDKVGQLLEKTRQKVIEVSSSEQFRSTMESGRDFLIGAGTMIADGLKYGYDKLREIPEVNKAASYVDAKVDELRHSEKLKEVVDRSQQGLNDLNNAIFNGLKSFFSTPDEKKDDLPDLPEQDDDPKTGA